MELLTDCVVEEYASTTTRGNSDSITEALSMMRVASQLIRLVDANLPKAEINQRLDVTLPKLNHTINASVFQYI